MALKYFRVVRQVNERATGRGVRIRDGNEGSWEIKQVLFADDTVLVAKTRGHLQHTVNELVMA